MNLQEMIDRVRVGFLGTGCEMMMLSYWIKLGDVGTRVILRAVLCDRKREVAMTEWKDVATMTIDAV